MQQTLNTQLFKHCLNLHKLVFLPFSIISILQVGKLKDRETMTHLKLSHIDFHPLASTDKMCSVPYVPE